MLERVAGIINRYNMFPPGRRVGVAVSGGADSVCLLHALVELAPRYDLRLQVLHFNHKLRGEESDADERFVADLAHRLCLEFHRGEADVRSLRAAARDNLEQTARRARYAFLKRFIRDGELDAVALAHTRSDQAETVLFRLLRGSSLAGLAGILPVTADGLVRPLLEIDRSGVEQYLKERRIAWREDSSNADRSFARNRIRHELLPWLEQHWNPQLPKVLAHMAALAHDEETYWDAEIRALSERMVRVDESRVVLNTRELATLPRALLRRVLRNAVRLAKGDTRSVDFGHVEALLDLVSQREGRGAARLPGLEAIRSFHWLCLAPGDTSRTTRHWLLADLAVPGTHAVPGCRSEIHLELIETKSQTLVPADCATVVSELNWRLISGPVELRDWRPGDCYRPVGHAHPRKLKDLFHNSRVPSWKRAGWPILMNSGKIIWTRQFGAAAEFAAGADDDLRLRIWESDSGER